ncbi:MAG TPA: FtsH protease activity modulator HflK [Gammaproteobacteria bacterium]|nr:FtsH protease activity modulator HflK [Gammaproteobacteria bacterium]
MCSAWRRCGTSISIRTVAGRWNSMSAVASSVSWSRCSPRPRPTPGRLRSRADAPGYVGANLCGTISAPEAAVSGSKEKLMAWNEPGGSGNRDPWGRRADAGPPDLDELFRRLRQRFGGDGGNGGGSANSPPPALWGGLLLLLLVLWLASGFYVVSEGERGVVLRFGKFASTATPGLRWHVPYPVERVLRVNIGEIRTAEVGYRGAPRDRAGDMATESQMLTADENIVDVKLAVQYRVKDAANYVFKVRDPDLTVQQVAESAIREVVGKSRMEFILTEGRDAVAQQVAVLLQETLDRYQAGIEVTSVNMQDAQPPEQVQAAFYDAVKAREDEQRLINEAQAYRNEVIPRARGEVARIVADAEAYKGQIVARAEGEAARFSLLANEYRVAPAVTRQRLYLETMEQVLARTPKVLMQGEGNRLTLLPLDRLLQSSRAADEGQASASPATAPPSPPQSTPARVLRDRSDYVRGREPRS